MRREQPTQAHAKTAWPCHEDKARRFALRDSGDHRLSRQGHYHRPDGLNGRVRNGNGWDPVSMFAGKAHGGRSGRAGGQYGGGTTHNRCQNRLSTGFNGPILRSDAVGTNDLGVDRIPLSMEVEVGKRFIVLPPWIDRVGQVPCVEPANGSGWSSGWLLGPVGCGDRSPCTSGLSTWSSSRSLRT